MGVTKISWTQQIGSNGEVIPGFTFNPWIGCTKVAPECLFCYAENMMDMRYGRVKWGAGQLRSRTSPANWKQPLKWNRQAAAAGVRYRVFCASLADWLDSEVPIEWLADLLLLIEQTPNLDWLLLSKRIESWSDRLHQVVRETYDGADDFASSWLDGDAPHNVWMGTTAGTQATANSKVPALAETPAEIRFLSCEPLLEPIDFTQLPLEEMSWVICGGESGHGARLCDAAWMRKIRNQCTDRDVKFFVKQAGENFRDSDYPERDYSQIKGKGDDIALFPFDLQIQESPSAEAFCNAKP